VLDADLALLLDELHEAILELFPVVDDVAFSGITEEPTDEDVVLVLGVEV
jgi:hypothetical protein